MEEGGGGSSEKPKDEVFLEIRRVFYLASLGSVSWYPSSVWCVVCVVYNML